jgi:exodeoxyribonuclease V beta subunit
VASFTSLAAAASSAGDEPLRADDVREAAPGADDASDAAPMHAELPPLLLAAPSAWEGLRGGRDAGTWVHAVLERLDFATGTAKADGAPLADLAGGLGKRHGIADPVQHRLVAELLPAALATPIGGGATGLAASWALRDLPASDRVDELGFDLALTTGTTWRPGDATVDPAAVRAALANRAGDKAFSGHKWLRALLTERAPLPLAAGLVTGYIDLVLRCDGRYWLADYKTNRIAPPHDRHDSRLYHYSAPWLEREMARNDYHLQALLYSLAVHRWLRQRVDGWDYERHFGGHLYLFLRGMHGATTPRDANGLSLGAYHDRWPLSVVAALDAALAGGA